MYTISKADLVKMIKLETNLGFKRVLQNHLRVMEGLAPDCITCGHEEEMDAVQEEIVEDTDEEGDQ